MFKIFKYLTKREWLFMAIAVGFVVLQVYLEVTMPDYTQAMIGALSPGENGALAADAMSVVGRNGGIMIAMAISNMLATIVTAYFMAKIAAGLSATLRRNLFFKVSGYSMAEVGKFSTASLITRTTNDVTQIMMIYAMGLQFLFKAPIMAIWGIVKIVDMEWEWVVATALIVLFLVATLSLIMLYALPKFKKIQLMTDDVNRLTKENLEGVRVVRAYNAQGYQEEKFEKTNEKFRRTGTSVGRAMALFGPIMSIVMQGITIAVYGIGAVLMNNAPINANPMTNTAEYMAQAMARVDIFSNTMSFVGRAMPIIFAFLFLTMIFVMMPRAQVSAKRILEVLNLNSSVADGGGANPEEEGTVEFKNVSFKYPDAEDYALKNISFTAARGKTLAFIGATGSGKSTLINLVPRFFDATEGEVLVDGVSVKDYKLDDLYNRVGYIPQRSVIFSGTVEDNVNYGKGSIAFSDEGATEALKTAQGWNFVEELDGGLKARVARGGTNLSGGQKQRLSIARGIAKKPEIIIFDDTFSALDYATDRALRQALKDETVGLTKLIVAQRIGTIKDADEIIVLSDGEIVGRGKHRELLETSAVYKEIALSQLKEEELL